MCAGVIKQCVRPATCALQGTSGAVVGHVCQHRCGVVPRLHPRQHMPCRPCTAGTSGAVPLGMYASIVAVWFLISIPLTFAGGFMALSLPIPKNPVKTNQIPRHIPPPSAGAHPTVLFFLCAWRGSAP